MNIIIDQPKLVSVVKLYLTKNFSNLNLKTSEKHPELSFYINSDNKILMEHNKKYKSVWIDNNLIWSKLESLFYLNYDDIQLIMKDWLKRHYNLMGVTPHKIEELTFES